MFLLPPPVTKSLTVNCVGSSPVIKLVPFLNNAIVFVFVATHPEEGGFELYLLLVEIDIPPKFSVAFAEVKGKLPKETEAELLDTETPPVIMFIVRCTHRPIFI